MTDRRILARLPLPVGAAPLFELVLADVSEEGSPFVRFETACLDHATGERSAARAYLGTRSLAEDVLRAATSDYVARYLGLVEERLFRGNAGAAIRWMLADLKRELHRIRS